VSYENRIHLDKADNLSDFIATQFPDADDDELIDVVSMDFALDDLRKSPVATSSR
jgi:hypothetical protein